MYIGKNFFVDWVLKWGEQNNWEGRTERKFFTWNMRAFLNISLFEGGVHGWDVST